MLYVTTRNKADVFTAYHTLKKDTCEDGGLYVPFQLKSFTSDEIADLKNKSFGQCVAEVLNLFFSARLDSYAVDFCIGKNASKLVPMSHKIVIAENWHNPQWSFSRIVQKLSDRILDQEMPGATPTNWTQIAVRIAVLFGLYGEMLRSGYTDIEKKIDVVVTTGDFAAPMAVWYARKMGLPVGNIICGCNDSDALWNLLFLRQLHTGSSVPANLERFIYETLGLDEAAVFCSKSAQGRIYEPSEDRFDALRNGFYAAVISEKRTDNVIRNVFRASSYLLSSHSAAAYGGLQDYRASTGEGNLALILTEQSPVSDWKAVSRATGLSEWDIKDKFGSV